MQQQQCSFSQAVRNAVYFQAIPKHAIIILQVHYVTREII